MAGPGVRMTVFALCAGLAACQSLGGAVSFLHKTGSTPQQRASAIDACQVSALRDVPPSYQTRTVGGYGGFGRYGGFGPRYCVGSGCFGYRGFAGPPTVVSYDPNEALRARQFQRCLSKRGYTLQSKPSCTTQKEANAYQDRKRQQSLARISCVSGEPRIDRRWLVTR
ncbi:MAG: hypothetical protein JJ866_03900 [Roseibium sp.]|uniref:hypothetical protein n=1 Tax=Roseibium sp. TaxID=1936156 RepID=UPI001B09F7C1|nr:hypothetical protein [Roseibium sp.]MBO6891063.1 hypothetical protein [Roseibium sp.]MBO6928397.1 hypothetical protein [Roseibium sp.]